MRIRSIKPEFWRSKDIAGLSVEDRLLFIGLWSYVDDNGVGIDEEASIVADLFAADMFSKPSETVARVSRGLQKLFEANLITRYEVENRAYLQITTWDEHQRIDKPAKARYPRNDAELATIRESVASDVANVATGTGEQRNRGTEEQVKRTPPPKATMFDQAWDAWPKKTEKAKSLEAYERVLRSRPESELLADVIRFGRAYEATTAKQFVPALVVWLRHERWTDELPGVQSGSTITQSKAEREIQAEAAAKNAWLAAHGLTNADFERLKVEHGGAAAAREFVNRQVA